ncbi:hypothetical protein PN441_19515 [Spirulina major CS-329]|uniref:hypothetical protein n=1 Tax=Spirulina sp. TaxID=1157 RepID=UPI003F727639|nr:hypothetical protein [Spirulina subsalsa CS-330]MDB9505273.1 hypothetical protein [Spirulina major CS-329]
MSYRTRLHNWVIVRQLPNMQRVVVRRFVKRADAENCVIILRRFDPQMNIDVMFDPPLESPHNG